MRLTRRSKHGFTLIELMVVIAIIAALAALLLPVISDMIDNARARACTANLKSHGVAFFTYKQDNQGMLPVLFSHSAGTYKTLAYTDKVLAAGTASGTPDDKLVTTDAIRIAMGSNPMQNVWLVIDGGYVGGGEKAYRCPADGKYQARVSDATTKYGWTTAYQFSYSIAMPYAGTDDTKTTPDATWNWANPNGLITGGAAAGEADYKGKQMYSDSGIYMADRNPRKNWTTVAYPGNSNHGKGVCYVEKGGTNGFIETNDAKVGISNDDIYLNRNTTTGLPYLAPSAATIVTAPSTVNVGYSIVPCNDTVLWPLNARP